MNKNYLSHFYLLNNFATLFEFQFKCKQIVVLFTILLALFSTTPLTAQIYTPNGILQGSSNNTNIGIGTSSPEVKLDVLSTNVAAFFRSTINVVPISIINSGSAISTVGFKGLQLRQNTM
jgi:hypothetical protein